MQWQGLSALRTNDIQERQTLTMSSNKSVISMK